MVGSTIIIKEGTDFYLGGICTMHEILDEETGTCKKIEWP